MNLLDFRIYRFFFDLLRRVALALAYRVWWFYLQFYGYVLFGKKVGVLGMFSVVNPRNVSVGKDLGINHGVFILGACKIEIGNNVVLSARCMLIDSSLDVNQFLLSYKPPHVTAPIIISDSVWVGAGAIILPGVTIGEKSVIAAGSVVTRSVPSKTLVAGVPAKIIRNLG